MEVRTELPQRYPSGVQKMSLAGKDEEMEGHLLLVEDMEEMGEKIHSVTKVRTSSLHLSIQHFEMKLF